MCAGIYGGALFIFVLFKNSANSIRLWLKSLMSQKRYFVDFNTGKEISAALFLGKLASTRETFISFKASGV